MCRGLDHTTGFPNWRQFNTHGNNKLEIFFRPGEHFAYSGEGISLLQLAVETVTGADGKVIIAILDDEGEHHALKKVR